MPKPVVIQAIDFNKTPAIGALLMKEGQRYELAAANRHIRKDGTPTILLTWQSHCADCGLAFEIVSGLRAKGSINRRCPLHTSPGRSVTAKGRARQQTFMARHGRRQVGR